MLLALATLVVAGLSSSKSAVDAGARQRQIRGRLGLQEVALKGTAARFEWMVDRYWDTDPHVVYLVAAMLYGARIDHPNSGAHRSYLTQLAECFRLSGGETLPSREELERLRGRQWLAHQMIDGRGVGVDPRRLLAPVSSCLSPPLPLGPKLELGREAALIPWMVSAWSGHTGNRSEASAYRFISNITYARETGDRLVDWFLATSPDLHGMPFGEAVFQADTWRMKAEENRNVVPHSVRRQLQAQPRFFSWPDGWGLVLLRDAKALALEAWALDHCLGDRDYRSMVKDHKHQFVSLRDPEGLPRTTFQLLRDWSVMPIQVRGRTNHHPAGKTYEPSLRALDHLAPHRPAWRSDALWLLPGHDLLELTYDEMGPEIIRHLTKMMRQKLIRLDAGLPHWSHRLDTSAPDRVVFRVTDKSSERIWTLSVAFSDLIMAEGTLDATFVVGLTASSKWVPNVFGTRNVSVPVRSGADHDQILAPIRRAMEQVSAELAPFNVSPRPDLGIVVDEYAAGLMDRAFRTLVSTIEERP